MLATLDLGGLAALFGGVAMVLSAVNTILNTVIHRRTERLEPKVDRVNQVLDGHLQRVETTYDGFRRAQDQGNETAKKLLDRLDKEAKG